jgi:hypothetical protein
MNLLPAETDFLQKKRIFALLKKMLAVPDPVDGDSPSFTYPLRPPAVLVDLVLWWGKMFDPVLLARPAWWKATIWIDALLFGPFYLSGF